MEALQYYVITSSCDVSLLESTVLKCGYALMICCVHTMYNRNTVLAAVVAELTAVQLGAKQ
jgi:hypothetical protein